MSELRESGVIMARWFSNNFGRGRRSCGGHLCRRL